MASAESIYKQIKQYHKNCKIFRFSIWKLFSPTFSFFLIGIHSMQDWTTTTRHGVTRKRITKRLKHTENLFRKNLQLIGVC